MGNTGGHAMPDSCLQQEHLLARPRAADGCPTGMLANARTSAFITCTQPGSQVEPLKNNVGLAVRALQAGNFTIEFEHDNPRTGFM